MEGVVNKSNFEIDEKENRIVVSINPKIYCLDVVYSAAYIMLDRAYIVIDGDPEDEILVEIRPKEGFGLEDLGNHFNNELINYSVYKVQSEKNKDIRQTLVQRALLTNGFNDSPDVPETSDDDDDDDDDFFDDPEGIAVPWEEKYGDKSDGIDENTEVDSKLGEFESKKEIQEDNELVESNEPNDSKEVDSSEILQDESPDDLEEEVEETQAAVELEEDLQDKSPDDLEDVKESQAEESEKTETVKDSVNEINEIEKEISNDLDELDEDFDEEGFLEETKKVSEEIEPSQETSESKPISKNLDLDDLDDLNISDDEELDDSVDMNNEFLIKAEQKDSNKNYNLD